MGEFLAPDEPPAFTILNPEGRSGVLLTCEHAGNAVPRQLNMLGLDSDDYTRHYATDVGARQVTSFLSDMLDAPAILGNYSRLVIDLNRSTDHPTTFAPTGEGKPVPGNIGITDDDKVTRIREVYEPYHDALTRMLDGYQARNQIPVVVSVHSFTPVFFNFRRPWEIGFLSGDDYRLSDQMINMFLRFGHTVGDNEPYDHRVLRGNAMTRHAAARRLPHTLVEFRNDLISLEKDAFYWAKLLADGLQEALANPLTATYYDGLQLPYDPEKERTYFADLVERAKRGEP
jgi:predicted N-formylglutamate amidohydrolase